MAFGHHVVTVVLKGAEPRRGETTKNTKLQSDNNRERAEGLRHGEGAKGDQGWGIILGLAKLTQSLFGLNSVTTISGALALRPPAELSFCRCPITSQTGKPQTPPPGYASTYGRHRWSLDHSPLCSCRTETFGKTRSFYARRRRRRRGGDGVKNV